MRTNIDIDDDLLAKAMEVSGLRTKEAVIEDALRLLVEAAGQRQAIEDMRGLGWEGDLDVIRSTRH
jgi:Arc/MetJ family transcription regulator